MSLRAGGTLYHRVLDNQREFWIVDGFRFGDTSNEDKVWKVKRDRVSGRFFFVNLGISGLKKWKLPDITDPRYEDETYMALHGGPTNNSTGHNIFGNSNTGTAGYNNYNSNNVINSPGTPPNHHNHQAGFENTKSGRDAGEKASSAANIYLSSTPDAAAASFAAFDYGGDLLHASPLRKEEELRARQLDEKKRLEEKRLEELAMQQLLYQQQQMLSGMSNNNKSFGGNSQFRSASGGGGAGGNGPSNPRFYDLASQAEMEATRHSAEIQRQVEQTRRMEESVSRQRERNDLLINREMELTSELEKQQLSNIEQHAVSLQAHVDMLRGTTPTPTGGQPQHFYQQQQPTPNNNIALRSTSQQSLSATPNVLAGYHTNPSPTPNMPGNSSINNNNNFQPNYSISSFHPGVQQQQQPSQPQQQQQQPSSYSVSSPAAMDAATAMSLTILQEQLELERKRNDELKRQLSERDRIILGTQLSEVERERRDMNLRLKMLEAMAAFRKRRGVYDADSGRAANNRNQILRQEPL